MNGKSKPSFLLTAKMRKYLSEQKFLKIVCVELSAGSKNQSSSLFLCHVRQED